MTEINRDPFARETLCREAIHRLEIVAKGCEWCGNHNGFGGLFRYFIETDGDKRHEIDGLFCSVGCLRSFNL